MSEECDLPVTRTIKTLFRHNTDFCADSIEWCPFEPDQNVFLCGNYQYQEGTPEAPSNKRLGKLMLFSITTENTLKLNLDHDTAAVLDIKWCHNKINNVPVFGVANADQKVNIYSFKNKKIELLSSFVIPDESKDTLALSLDWSTGKFESLEPCIVCSDSKGQIHILKFTNGELIHEKTWKGHDFQAWICAFYYWDPNVVFSGGDDALFLQFDRRAGDLPVMKNRKHETGITSLHSNIAREFILATGSYDEKIRLWDLRSLKTPVSELKMPGPLWRLKWDPFSQDYLLAACMLGGVHVVKSSKNCDLDLFDSYYEHKNISYGADWCHLSKQEVENFGKVGNVILGSCSFYDKLVCVSNMECDFGR